MPHATIDGIKINYVVQGSGPPLIMLAPGGFDSNIDGWSTRGVWKDLRPLEALAKSVMALPLPTAPHIASPEAEGTRLAPHRIKRCNYRRLISLERPQERVYEVEFLYPDRKLPIPLGDLDSSLPICNACTAAHIFRPDED